MKKTCVIIINFFGSAKTKKCLKSLAGQAVDTIRLVDNSVSYDESQNLSKLVKEFSAHNNYPAVQIHINSDNIGFGKAVNMAIRQDMENSGGHDFYMIINNDAEATPGMVEKLVSLLEQDASLSLVSPRVIFENGSINRFWYNKIFGSVSHTRSPFSFPFLSGCCLIFRKSLVEDAPLFDEDFFMYGEDVHLSWRVQKQGGFILCARDIPVLHEGTGSSNHGGFFYEHHVARGHVLLALKTCEHLPEIPLLVLGRIIYLSARACAHALKYGSPLPFLALISCWIPFKVRPEKRHS